MIKTAFAAPEINKAYINPIMKKARDRIAIKSTSATLARVWYLKYPAMMKMPTSSRGALAINGGCIKDQVPAQKNDRVVKASPRMNSKTEKWMASPSARPADWAKLNSSFEPSGEP